MIRPIIIAGYSDTTSEMLAELALDEYELVRERVASHSNTSLDTLLMLARDKDLSVLLSVAGNEKTPAEVLLKLFNSIRDWRMRMVIASHKNTPAEVLIKLYKDTDEEIMSKLLHNKSFEPKVREYAKSLGINKAEKLYLYDLLETL